MRRTGDRRHQRQDQHCAGDRVPGRVADELVAFDGLLGSAPVMRVNPFSDCGFMRRGGWLPATVMSLRNEAAGEALGAAVKPQPNASPA